MDAWATKVAQARAQLPDEAIALLDDPQAEPTFADKQTQTEWPDPQDGQLQEAAAGGDRTEGEPRDQQPGSRIPDAEGGKHRRDG